MENLDETLVDACKSGEFLGLVYKLSRDRSQQAQSLLIERLSDLHNKGAIDVVYEFSKLKNDVSERAGPDFFLTRHLFEGLLAHINAETKSLMSCVIALRDKAGQDMAAGTIIDKFMEYCATNPQNAGEALNAIKDDSEQYKALIPATLIAGSRIDPKSYLAELLNFCEEQEFQIRGNAVFALGGFCWDEFDKIPEEVISTLSTISQNSNEDDLLSVVLRSAFLIDQTDKTCSEKVFEICERCLNRGGDQTLYSCSALFAFHTKALSDNFLTLFVVSLKRVNPDHKGIIDNIDFGLQNLLDLEKTDFVLEFLESYLINHPRQVEFEAFGSLTSKIYQDQNLLNRFVTRWFLKGDAVLCDGIAHIVESRSDHNLLPEIDINEVDHKNWVHLCFVARKAIGYLFIKPVSCVSLLVSIMKVTRDKDALDALQNLLYNPLLINYPGKPRQFIEEKLESVSSHVKPILQKVLSQLDSYTENLRSIGTLNALHPVASQREQYNRHMREVMAKHSEAAEQQSVFLSLVHKSLLLYGRGSITYVRGLGSDKSHRMENPLGKISVEIEHPRLTDIDPFGIEYTLRIFRIEKIRDETNHS